MSAAIFGLIGVVVGALVTGGVDYVMQRRREKAELRQARRPRRAQKRFGETLAAIDKVFASQV